MKFFRHVVSASGVSIDPEKIRGRSQFLRYAVSWDWRGTTGGSLRISPG